MRRVYLGWVVTGAMVFGAQLAWAGPDGDCNNACGEAGKDLRAFCFKDIAGKPHPGVNWQCTSPRGVSAGTDKCTCSGTVTFYADHERKVEMESRSYTVQIDYKAPPKPRRKHKPNPKAPTPPKKLSCGALIPQGAKAPDDSPTHCLCPAGFVPAQNGPIKPTESGKLGRVCQCPDGSNPVFRNRHFTCDKGDNSAIISPSTGKGKGDGNGDGGSAGAQAPSTATQPKTEF